MTRTVVTAVLMLTQLLSWSAAPLFLCLNGNGSVCIDRGPENCESCHDCHNEGAHAACCGEADDCLAHNHHDAEAPNQKTIGSRTCDCTHIQLCAQQIPTIVRSSSSVDANLHAAWIGDAILNAQANGWWNSSATPPLLGLCLLPDLPPAGLKTVVLRC